jgi:hypothetical protein
MNATRQCRGRATVGRTLVVGAFLAVMAAVLEGGGCYHPTVLPGGFKCAPLPEKQCPDGLVCDATSGMCVTTIGGGAGTGGSGGAGGSCANPIAPLCQTDSAATGECDPVCQIGCGCGLQCGMTPTGIRCTSARGLKLEDETCQPATDNCAPGLVCVKEVCATIGRCHRFCRDGSVCTATGVCGPAVSLPNGVMTTQRACNLGDHACDPIARTGCPDPALNCYVTSGHTTCDCPSGMDGQVGANCSFANDCAEGLACINAGGSSRCRTLCRSGSDCPGCTLLIASVGYCP